MRQRARVVQGALCFSPATTKATTRDMEREVGEVAGRSPDKWASVPSTSDISTNSSSHYSALTHPFACNHPYTNNHFSRVLGRSASIAGGQGQQLLNTPLLQSIPRGYSFLLSLAQGYPANPRRQQKQVQHPYHQLLTTPHSLSAAFSMLVIVCCTDPFPSPHQLHGPPTVHRIRWWCTASSRCGGC